MNWDQVIEDGVRPTIVADAEIAPIMGDRVFMAGSRGYVVSSVTWLLIFDTEEENWAPFDVQFDVFSKSLNEVRTVARALRRLFHQELQFELQGLDFKLWGQLLEGRGFEGPDEDGDHRYSMDFRFTPGRSLYLTAQES